MNFAARLAATIGVYCADDPETYKELQRRRLRQWQRVDVDVSASPRRMLVDFAVYMLDVDGDPVYFAPVFDIIAMACGDVAADVRLVNGPEGFASAVSNFCVKGPNLDGWRMLLEGEIEDDHGGPAHDF